MVAPFGLLRGLLTRQLPVVPRSQDRKRRMPHRTRSVLLDVHFISSLPVILRSACKAWVDREPVQIVAAED